MSQHGMPSARRTAAIGVAAALLVARVRLGWWR